MNKKKKKTNHTILHDPLLDKALHRLDEISSCDTNSGHDEYYNRIMILKESDEMHRRILIAKNFMAGLIYVFQSDDTIMFSAENVKKFCTYMTFLSKMLEKRPPGTNALWRALMNGSRVLKEEQDLVFKYKNKNGSLVPVFDYNLVKLEVEELMKL